MKVKNNFRDIKRLGFYKMLEYDFIEIISLYNQQFENLVNSKIW